MNQTGVLTDIRDLVFSPQRIFAFFRSYENPSPWLFFKVVWIFFVVSILKSAFGSHFQIESLGSINFEMGSFAFEIPPVFKSVLTWISVWTIILEPFLSIARVLSWTSLTYLVLDGIQARPQSIGFSKLFLMFCMLSWLEIFLPFTMLTYIWIFYLSAASIHFTLGISKLKAFFVVTASFWILVGAVYLSGIAILGGLFALLL
jgi:hypothetical protein